MTVGIQEAMFVKNLRRVLDILCNEELPSDQRVQEARDIMFSLVLPPSLVRPPSASGEIPLVHEEAPDKRILYLANPDGSPSKIAVEMEHTPVSHGDLLAYLAARKLEEK